MDPELFKEFCAEFVREVNRLRQVQAGLRSAFEAQLARTKARIRKIVDAIAEGVPARSLGTELLALEASQDEITTKLAATPEPKVYLMPNMAEFYRQRVSDLQQVLAGPGDQADAFEAVRGLIDKIMLTPVEGALRIDLHGEGPPSCSSLLKAGRADFGSKGTPSN